MLIHLIGSERVDLHTVHVKYRAQYTHDGETSAGAFTTVWSCLNPDNEVQGCYFTGEVRSSDQVLFRLLQEIIHHGAMMNYNADALSDSGFSSYDEMTQAFSASAINKVAIPISNMAVTGVNLYDTDNGRDKRFLTIDITINDLFVIRHTEAHGFTIPHSSDVACYDADNQNTAHYIHNAELIAQYVNLPTTFEEAIKFIESGIT